MTEHFEIETGPTRPPETGFARLQTLSIRNVSDEPVLSPLHLVLSAPEGDRTLRGPQERVLLIIGAAHRAFNEAEMRVQPWLTVEFSA